MDSENRPIYGLFDKLNVSIKISSMFCVRKRNVSFTHTKPMFDREEKLIITIFRGYVFYVYTSLLFELLILRNNISSPYRTFNL